MPPPKLFYLLVNADFPILIKRNKTNMDLLLSSPHAYAVREINLHQSNITIHLLKFLLDTIFPLPFSCCYHTMASLSKHITAKVAELYIPLPTKSDLSQHQLSNPKCKHFLSDTRNCGIYSSCWLAGGKRNHSIHLVSHRDKSCDWIPAPQSNKILCWHIL